MIMSAIVSISEAGGAFEPPRRRAVWGIALLALLVLGLAACCPMPVNPCGMGKVALEPRTTYAVYINPDSSKPAQVEDTRAVVGRCIVAVSEPASPPARDHAPPSCPAGTEALRSGTVGAQYFKAYDISTQLEDTRTVADRCIVPIVPTTLLGCPPGFREKTIQGAKYCVPAP
jgi:hypothetical protein